MTDLAAHFAPHRDRLVTWWRQRTTRERALLLAMVALLAITALVSLVIRPLHATRVAALADIRVYDTLAVRLRAGGPISASPIARSTGDAAAIVQSSAPQFGLIARNVTANGTAVRVQMSAVAYESVVRWLADLDQTSDLRVRHLSLQPASIAGTVDVALVLTS